MKISRLRRALAVFLSVMMLTLCAPMTAFTAFATGTVYVTDIISGGGIGRKLYVGDVVAAPEGSGYTYNDTTYNFVYFYFENFPESGINEDMWMNESPFERFPIRGGTFTVSNSYTRSDISRTAGSYWELTEIQGVDSYLCLLFESDGANTEISTINIDVDMTKIPAINAGDAVPATVGPFTGGSNSSDDTVKVSTENVSYQYGWAIYDENSSSWAHLNDGNFESEAKYGFIVQCTVDGGYTFADSIELTGNIKDKCTVAYDTSLDKVYVVELGTIDDINAASGNGGSSTGFTITFNLTNGGALPDGTANTAITTDGRLAELPTPTREGYTFGGWYTDATKGEKVTTETPFDGNAIIYAQWLDVDLQSAVTYLENVQLNAVVGDTTGTKYVFSGIPELSQAEIDAGFKYVYQIATLNDSYEGISSIADEINNMLNNKQKLRINSNAKSSEIKDIPEDNTITVEYLSIAGLAKINVNAHKEGDADSYYCFACKYFPAGKVAAPIEYTITLKYQDDKTADTTAKTTNGKLAELPTPTREGYTFGGWYTDATKGEKVTTETPFDGNTTVYAQWLDVDLQSAVTYLESVQLNAADGDATGTKYVFSGIPELSQAEIDAGFKYVYFSRTMDGTYEEIASSAEANNNLTKNNQLLRINTAIGDVQDIPEDKTITVDTLSGVGLIKINAGVRGDIGYKIFAQKNFAAGKAASSTEYTITFDLTNGGALPDGTANTAITTDGKLAELPTPTREGFTFGGWYTDATKGEKVTTETPFDGNTTVYAQWLDVDLQGAVTYLESVQLNAVVGDATGTKYVFSGIPELSQAEIDAGFKYVYIVYIENRSYEDLEFEVNETNNMLNINAVPRIVSDFQSSEIKDIPEDNTITVEYLSYVGLAKINVNAHKEGDADSYYCFAGKNFPAGKAAAPADFTITLDPNDGALPEGTESTATTTDGKLTSLPTPTREGYVFGGWYVWSTSVNDEVLVDDNYTFTDDNIRENEESITISAQWYKAYNNIYVSDQSSLLYGYSTGTPSTIGDDAPLFYLDTNGFAKATITDINWYCVDSGSTFDPDTATKCNDTTVSTDKDYYLVCTVSVGTTAYRFGDQLTAQAEYGSEPTYTIHSKDSTTATISWQITPYEVITKLSNISIDPDITSPSYKLEPGDAPAEFTGTATYTTKSGKTGELNLAVVKWVEEAEHLYWDNAVDTIEDGSSYVPMFAFEFPGQYYVPASIDYFNVDGMTNLETDSDSYSFDVENSFEAIVLNAEAITASAGSSVLDKPIEYLEDVTLTPVSGDTTGTKFEFGSIPIIPFEDFEAGYKYIYIVFPDDDPKSAVEIFNKVKNGQINVKDTYYAMPLSFAADLPTAQTAQITVGEKAAVFIAKVNTNYSTELAYYTFALKVFAVTPEAPTPTEYTITLKYQDDKTADGSFTTKGGVLTELPTPTRDGYTFKGWFDAATEGTEVTTATVFEQDTTIYAQWEAVSTPENKAEKAAKDITTALGDIKPTNDTTKDDIQAIVDKNKGDTTATVTTFTLTPATTEAGGSLTVTVTVSDGTNTETVEKTYTIEKLPAAPENKAEKAAEDITTALGDIKLTNDTTKDAVQAIVDKNKGDTTATVTDFNLTPATEEKEGSLTVTVTVSDGTNTETVEKTYTIDKLPKHEHTFGAWTVVKEATATEEGLLRRTCTVEGCTEVEEKTIPKLEESKGESEGGNVVDTTPEDNSFSAAIPDISDTAENIELTPEESVAIADGSTLSIFLKVTENLDEDKKEDEKAITDKADSEELTIGSFLDVSLFKQIGDDTPVAVTNTKNPIKVSFIVPDDLIAEGRAYYIIRTHGSETTVIECEFDAATKTCTFETDKFSSYAIAYKAAPAEEDDIEKFVERLYLYMLGRHSDPEGKANHVANLRNGETAVKVSFDFVYSDEFKNMGLTNKEIAERLYLTFLDRTPDEAGLADWTATLDGGCSIGHLFYGFTQSNEFTELCEKYGIVRGDWTVMETRDVSSKLTAFVSRLYTKALNRGFDVDGLNNHTANYIANHDLYQLAYDFIFSSEFTEKELSDEDFVDTMYRTFFDREGDPDGRADWIGKLKSGMSREEVLAGFVGSQECADLVAKFGI